MSSTAGRYYPQLDALRAIAVAMVLLSHFLVGGPWGDYGVRLFFVLSGFLITSTLIVHREHMQAAGVSVRVVARNFYIRRSLRLFPIYYLSLLVYLALSSGFGLGGVDRPQDWLYHFGYLSNVLVFQRNEWLGALSPYWSLAVEEQFYLLWFWIVLYTPTRWLPAAVVMVILSAPLFRGLSYAAGQRFYADVLLPACVDTLGTGALLALAVHPGHGQRFAALRQWAGRHAALLRGGAVLCAVLLLACSFGSDKDSLVRRLMVNLLSSALFAYVVHACYRGVEGAMGRLLSSPALIAVGKFSYGVYVYHMLVLLICNATLTPMVLSALDLAGAGPARRAIEFIIPAVLTLTVARLSWSYVEAPILRLKNRYSEGLGSV